MWVEKAIADMVRRTGLQRLMFKFDQVPSILGLKNKVVAELGGSQDVIVEASLVDEHQSKGVYERTGQTVGGMIRTHKLPLEQSYSKEWEAGHVVILWLTMRASAMVSLFETGSDGRTSWERRPWQTVPERVTHVR